MHQEMNLTVHRDGELSGDAVIFRVLLGGGIEATKSGGGFADLVSVDGAKAAIRPGITKIKCKLSRLNLNGNGIGRRRSKVDGAPSLGAEYAQSQNLSADKQESRDDQAHGAARESFDFFAGLGAGKLPDEKCQENLRGEE